MMTTDTLVARPEAKIGKLNGVPGHSEPVRGEISRPDGVQDPANLAPDGHREPGDPSLQKLTSAPPESPTLRSPLAPAPTPRYRCPAPQKEVRQTRQLSLRSGWLIWKGHLSSQGHVVSHEPREEVARGSLRR